MKALLTDAEKKIASAWEKAGAELGISVIAPFDVECDGCWYTIPVHIPNFGGPKGAALAVWKSQRSGEAKKVAAKLGLYFSMLNAELYSAFERARFIDALCDWGYYGPPELAPSWYERRIWGS